jgi:hypothetical protein
MAHRMNVHSRMLCRLAVVCTSLLFLGNSSEQMKIREDIAAIVITKPARGAVVEIFCNSNSYSEYLAIRFIWTDTLSFENERQCRTMNITATVNGNTGNMLDVGTDMALCTGKDNVWVVRNVCTSFWPFKEGKNKLHLDAFGVRGFRVASHETTFEITVDRSDNPHLAEDVSFIWRDWFLFVGFCIVLFQTHASIQSKLAANPNVKIRGRTKCDA